jgi:anti-anti-sigma factor
MNWWQRRGLRFKMALLVGLTLVVVLGAIFAIFILVTRNYLREREVQSALQTTTLLQDSIRNDMLSNDWQNLAEGLYVLGTASQNPPVETIAIYTERYEPGTVEYTRTVLTTFVTNFPEGRDIAQSSLEKKEYSAECAVCHNLPPGSRPESLHTQVEGQEVLRTTLGIYNDDREVLGMILVDYSQRKLNETSRLTSLALIVTAVITLGLVSLALYLLVNIFIIRPLRGMVTTTQTVAQGDWEQRVPVHSGDEVGRLGDAFNEMTGQLATAYADVQQALEAREEKATELQRALDEIQQGHAAQDRLLEMIREMSTPVIPVQEGVLVMPLVGIIDSTRAQGILSALLAAIEQEGARVIILDITGVPMVDTAVAQTLLQAARAARLLGADPVLVGISPQVAETIVSLGVDLTDLATKADLQSGVEYALRRSPATRGGRL